MCREKGNEEERKEVEQKGLKNETGEAEGMGLLQWQRKWGGSPDEGTVRSTPWVSSVWYGSYGRYLIHAGTAGATTAHSGTGIFPYILVRSL
jgi:hypothetical protein